MKFKEIKDLTVEELKTRWVSSQEDYFESKMKHSLGQLSNTNYIRGVRRRIARIQTALSQRNQSPEVPSPSPEKDEKAHEVEV